MRLLVLEFFWRFHAGADLPGKHTGKHMGPLAKSVACEGLMSSPGKNTVPSELYSLNSVKGLYRGEGISKGDARSLVCPI